LGKKDDNKNGNPAPPTHAGWKDTVNVPAMGTARIVMLEHEDNAMMERLDVVP
jgi:FtsP/CotA-like multicopper oxidase with cupredoxin domain